MLAIVLASVVDTLELSAAAAAAMAFGVSPAGGSGCFASSNALPGTAALPRASIFSNASLSTSLPTRVAGFQSAAVAAGASANVSAALVSELSSPEKCSIVCRETAE